MSRTQSILLTTVAALLIYIIIKRRRRRLRSQRRKIFLRRERRRLQRHKTFLQKEKRRLQWRQTLLQKRNAPSTSTAKTSSEDEHSSSFQSTENSTIQSTTTAEVSFDMNTPPVRSNPFLKSKKPSETVGYNPLSLTDKFAGYSEEIKSKETTPLLNNGKSEKRKQSDSEVDKPKDKQRKLEKFMFSKNPKL